MTTFLDWPHIQQVALKQLGKPYKYGAKALPTDVSPVAFDCSGFVQWVFAQGGIAVPEGSQQQFESSVNIKLPQFGDVGFFAVGPFTHHVGILLNATQVIEARGFEPSLEEQGIKTNCVLIRPKEKWDIWREFTGWKRFQSVME